MEEQGAKVNSKMLLSGTLAGLLLMFGVFSGLTATGFSVAMGPQTINIQETFTEDTLLPLSTPTDLTSLSISGLYRGSGDMRVHLVGPNQTWHLASYEAPQVELNSTYVLERGGTVVQLSEGERINHTYTFEDACGEACEGELQGPFYLQVRVREGSLTVQSAAYTTPQVISRPQAPEEEFEVDIPEPEPAPERQNPAPDCNAPRQDMQCLEGYEVSRTGHLNITDSSGQLVALFDKHGRLLLAGEVFEESEELVPPNAFRIQNRWGDIAWITDAGDLHLTGRLIEGVDEVPLSGAENFVIRNPEEVVLVVQGATGDLFTKNALVTGALS